MRQLYKTDASQEYVIVGNDALIQCQHPSFVSEFLTVLGWADSEGEFYRSGPNSHGIGRHVPQQACSLHSSACFISSFLISLISISVAHQAYRVAVHEESVILGNDVQFKCNIQSYATDFLTVTNWIDSEGSTYSPDQSIGNLSEIKM